MAAPNNVVTPMEAKMNIQTSGKRGMRPQFDKRAYTHIAIKNAVPEMLFTRLGKQVTIGKNNAKSVEIRRTAPLPLIVVPLVEGITPTGDSIIHTVKTVEVEQYGNYVTLSDIVADGAPDPQVKEASELLGANAGDSLEHIAGTSLAVGTNVKFAGGAVSRSTVVNGITFNEVKKLRSQLKKAKAKTDGGFYPMIMHTDVLLDLSNDPKVEAIMVQENDTIFKDIMVTKIGKFKIYESSSEALVVRAGDLVPNADPNLAIKTLQITEINTQTRTVNVFQTLSAAQATALAGLSVRVNGIAYTIASAVAGANGEATVIFGGTNDLVMWKDSVITTPGGGVDGRNVYLTYAFGKDSYVNIDFIKRGFEIIVKPATDPLNQRSTVGWKAGVKTVIAEEDKFIRYESLSSDDGDIPHVISGASGVLTSVELPDGEPNINWTVEQLKTYAELNGIDLIGANVKAEMVEKIRCN